MNSLRKLAEDYYNFILKYDECFYKKYQKEELLKVKILFNEILEKYSRPYKKLTSGKEIEELEYILSNDSDTLMNHLKMFDYLSDECYDFIGGFKMFGNILLGIVSICTMISYLPQTIRLIKTKKSEDLSINSWVLWVISSLAYTLYAVICSKDFMLIFETSLELFFCLLILMLAIKYRENN